MAKTWDQMSKEERNNSGLTKKEYNAKNGFGKQGEIAARSEAASRAEVRSNQSPATTTTPAAQANNQPAVNKGTGPDNHYSAADNMNAASQQMLDRKNKEKAYADKKAAGFEQASAYLAQGNSRDAQYDQILKDAGTGNSEYQTWNNAKRKEEYDANQQAKDQSNEAYRQSRLDLQNASNHSGHQIVDASSRYQNSSNKDIQKMVASGQKFTATEARRALDGNPDDNLYKGAGGFEAWQDMMGGEFKSQYDQSEYLTQDQAKANRDQLAADRTAFYEGEGNDKYGQYDWFQKDQARHSQGSTPKQAQNTSARTEASSRAAAYNPPTKVVQDKPKPDNSGKTNQYGDPEGTMYAGGSPTFNESTGQQESYTGADGTVTNGGNNSPSPRYTSWDDLQRESDMKSELMKQVDQAGGRYNFLQQQSGASEEDYWNNTNQYKFDKEAWADKTYGGQFS